MKELLNLAFSLINLPATILLLVMAVYWATVMVGLLDLKSLDFDVEADGDLDLGIDVDGDMDADLDADADGGVDKDIEIDKDVDMEKGGGGSGAGGAFRTVLSFLGIGDVPVTIYLGIFTLLYWMSTILINHYIGQNNTVFGFAVMLPLMFGSAFVTKLLTWPFKGIFKKMNDHAKPLQLQGKLCTVSIRVDKKHLGQAEFVKDGSSVLINVKSMHGETIEKGQKAVIIEKHNKKNIYFIEPFNVE